MLSGDSLLSDSALFSSTEDAHASPLESLCISHLMASNLAGGDDAAPEAAPLAAAAEDGGDEDPIAEPLLEADEIGINTFLEIVDLNDNPITSIDVGQKFRLKVFVEDVRTSSPGGENGFGVFSAYVRADYIATLVDYEDDSLNIGSFFPLLNRVDTSTTGELRAGGVGTSLVGPGTDPQLLWTAEFTATTAGTANFNTFFEDFSDVAFDGDWLLYGEPSTADITADNVTFNGASLEINDVDVPSISIGDVTQQETDDSQTFLFTVTLDEASNQQVTVAYSTQSGTATSGTDFQPASGTLTFAPSETQQIVTVTVNGDFENEADEDFTVVLSNPSGAVLLDDTGVGTIENDDVHVVDIADVQQLEGDEQNTLVFTVTLSKQSPTAVEVPWATQDVSAVAGMDYVAASGTVTFSAGSTDPQFITVTVIGDTDLEDNESFKVVLQEPSNAELGGDGEATATLQNDDGPQLSVLDVSVDENTQDGFVVFNVTLLESTGDPVTVVYTTADGTATAGSDYTATSGTLSFSGDTTALQVTVAITDDNVFEADETFTLELSNPSGATLLEDSATATILDDDTAPTLSVSDASVAENAGGGDTTDLVFTVELSGATELPATVLYTTVDGTAIADDDYQGLGTLTLSFAPGETMQLVTVTINNDALNENDETFQLRLFDGTNVSNTADLLATGTILNDDPLPTLSLSPASINEGSGGGNTNFVFTATLSAPSGLPVSAVWSTADGTAVAGDDYQAASGTITFAPGETTALLTVSVVADEDAEASETFTINLSDPQNVTADPSAFTATIANDDDVPVISIDADPSSQNEGDAGITPFVFTVTLSKTSQEQVTVQYSTTGLLADAGVDFEATSGTLTFAPGQTSMMLTVNIIGDQIFESNETFRVNISSPTGASIGTTAQTAVIANDDAAPTATINDVTMLEGDAGTKAFVFTVTLSQPSSQAGTLAYTTQNGTATAGNDYTATSGTLAFSAGQTVQMITVNVLGDKLVEGNETFSVVLSDGSFITIPTNGDQIGTGTIQDEATDDIEVIPSSVVGRVWVDSNGNGTQNGIERSLAGVQVLLTGASQAQTTTGADGTYSFNNLDPGTYTVEFVLPAEYRDGTAMLGSLGGTLTEDGYTFTIDSPGGVAASNYHFTTSGLQTAFLSQRLFLASSLGNLINPPAVAPTVAITSVTNPINPSSATNVSINGTGSAGATISVVASDGTNSTSAFNTTINSNGNWSINGVNVSSLADGTITFEVTATGAGGLTTEATITATKDTVAPSITIGSVTDPINIVNETEVTITGTGTEGDTVTVTATDGTTTTAAVSTTVDANDNWTISNIDVSGLNDGTITFNVVSTDNAGNSGTASVTAEKDTTAPEAEVTMVTDPVTSLNETEVEISGTASPEAAITVLFSDNDNELGPFSTEADQDGNWSISGINLSTLDDGTLTVVVTATDDADNTFSVTEMVEKDTIAEATIDPISNAVNQDTQDAFVITGTTEPGSTILVTVSDDQGGETEPADATVDENGNWTVTIDVSALADGPLTILVDAVDELGNIDSVETTAEKDTVVVFDVDDPPPAGLSNSDDYTVSGTVEEGATVTVVVTDGVDSTEPIEASVNGTTWTATGINLMQLADGELTIQITIVDAAGNTVMTTETTTKTAVDVTSIPETINAAQQSTVTISGVGEPGAMVTIVAIDAEDNEVTSNTVEIMQDGTWSIEMDLTGLVDGTIEFTVTATAGGNTVMLMETALLDTVADVMITDPTGAVNENNESAFEISGTVEPGSTVTVTIDDEDGGTDPIVIEAAVEENGDWSITADLSSLTDGMLTITADAVDSLGNDGQDTANVVKDTVDPVFDSGDLDPVGIANCDDYTVSGTAEEGATITVTISDGVNDDVTAMVTVDETEAWSIAGLDLSGLNEGDLTVTISAEDEAGNVADPIVEEITKTTLAIGEVEDPITSDNETAVTISGTVDPAATVTVTVDDEDAGTDPVVIQAGVDVDGNWTIDVDVSDLSDGTLTFTVEATAGDNTVTDTITATKDTVADVTVDVPAGFVNENNQDAFEITGTVEPGSTVTVTIDDDGDSGTDPVVVEADVDQDGNWTATADLSGLNDGTLTITVDAVDSLGNDGQATSNAEKDTVDPAFDLDALNAIGIANCDDYTVSGTGEEGATITVTISDGVNDDVTAMVTIDETEIWSIAGLDLSGLNDGELTVTVSAEDEAGNVADPIIEMVTKTTLAIGDVEDPISSDNQAAVTISGTVDPAATVTVTVDDEDAGTDPVVMQAGVDVDGNWTVDIDVSSLSDGTLTFTVEATVGDDTVTDTITAEKDTVADVVILDPTGAVNENNQSAFEITGTVEPGSTVTVTIDDEDGGTDPVVVEADVDQDGNWTATADLSSLTDGLLTITADAVDSLGNDGQDDSSVEKDTVDPVFALDTPDPVGIANADDYSVHGTGEEGATITVTISDGLNDDVTGMVTIDATEAWSVTGLDLSGLNDGNLTVAVTAEDTAGNTDTTDTTVAKSTVEIGLVDPDPINADNAAAVTISGTADPAATVTVSVDDEDGGTNPVVMQAGIDVDGNWTVDIDVSSLTDGTLTFTVEATVDDNTVTDTITAEKDTVADVVILDPTDAVNENNQSAFEITGTVEPGSTVTVTIDDEDGGTDPVVVEAVVDQDGNWTATADLSGLNDGPLTITADAVDGVGNAAQDDSSVAKDTVDPTFALDGLDPVGIANADAYTVSGTGEEGATITVTISDGENDDVTAIVTVDETETWSIADLDLSGLNDGDLTVTVTAEDAAGNTDTTDTTVAKSTLVIESVEDPIDADNETMVTISGTVDSAATVTVTVDDEDGGTDPVVIAANVDVDGNWTIDIDVSDLSDGTLTFTVEATVGDDTVTDMITAEKDTAAEPLAMTSDGDGDNVLEAIALAMSAGEENPSAVDEAMADENDWTDV